MVIGIKFVINKMYLLIDIFGNDICEQCDLEWKC